MDIRKMIREALGDMRFPSGALTQQAHGLILFANSNEWMVEFVQEHPDDKEAIFNKALELYKEKFGVDLSGDRETLFYDFMAHYKVPDFIRKIMRRKAEERKHGWVLPPRGSYRYIGQCDRLRRLPGGEELWQVMMSARRPIGIKEFLHSCDMTPICEEGETPEQMVADWMREDTSTAAYFSQWGDKPCMFIQTSGFEFIFSPE